MTERTSERQQLRAMVDDLDAAAQEYRNRDLLHQVAIAMHAAITALDSANEAQTRLIDKVVAANKFALERFNREGPAVMTARTSDLTWAIVQVAVAIALAWLFWWQW